MEGQHMEVGPDSGVRTHTPGLGGRVLDLEAGGIGVTEPWRGTGLDRNHIPRVLAVASEGNGLNLGLGRGSYLSLGSNVILLR